MNDYPETRAPGGGRPLGSPFPDRHKEVLAMKLAGRTRRQIRTTLGLNRNQIGSVIFALREKGLLPRPEPKQSRPRFQPLHRPKLPPRLTAGPANGIPVYMLGDRQCRWPIGYEKDEHRFCAAQTDGHVYCALHHKLGVQA